MFTRPEPEDNYGRDGDHCPECATDWRRPHLSGCSQIRCMYPPGCYEDATTHPKLCPRHLADLTALFGPAEVSA